MKPSKNDPFDLHLCIRGLGNQLTYMHNDILDYMYHMTVRGGISATREELYNLEKSGRCKPNQYRKSTDVYIKLCAEIDFNIRKYKSNLCTKWDINEVEDLQDERIIAQATRFSPALLRFKKSKNYLKVRAFYGQVLMGFVDCLCAYVCAVRAQSYKISHMQDIEFELYDQYDLKFKDDSGDLVRLINSLIDEIMDDVIAYNDLVKKKITFLGGLGEIRF